MISQPGTMANNGQTKHKRVMAKQVLNNGEAKGTIRAKINENFTELYDGKSDVSHDHDEEYAAIDHNHNGTYSLTSHNHDASYAALNHNHDASYAAIDHNHTGVYSPVGHNHDAAYSAINHNHAGTYEPADANIQSHIASAHAPSNAQKNSDITKAEIEAKLTGEITSHTHPGGGGGYDGDPTVINQDATHRFVSDTEKTTWNSKAAGDHNHDADYADINHDHDSDYAAIDHNHTGVYSPVGHNHDAAYQPVDTDLTAIAGIAPSNDDIIQRKLGAWVNRTPAQLKTDLSLTKSDVGLSNVDNTSDANKPVSTAQQTALDAKQATLVSATNIKTINGSSILGSGDLVIGGGSDPFTAKLILGSDVVTGANTTPVNLTGMTFNYEANATYVINIYASVTAAAATTGAGFGINCSTAPSIVSLNGLTTTGGTGAAAGWHTISNNAITATTAAIAAASPTNTPINGMGFVKMGGTAGTAQFIFRSETTAAATCRAGSVITVMKVS
jgi:hypothetical protein